MKKFVVERNLPGAGNLSPEKFTGTGNFFMPVNFCF